MRVREYLIKPEFGRFIDKTYSSAALLFIINQEIQMMRSFQVGTENILSSLRESQPIHLHILKSSAAENNSNQDNKLHLVKHSHMV